MGQVIEEKKVIWVNGLAEFTLFKVILFDVNKYIVEVMKLRTKSN